MLRRTHSTHKYATWLLLAGILLLAGFLRFYGLGAESLWLDEATSLVVADNAPAQVVAITAEDIHPPLYYLILRAWLVFGRTEAALRSLSAVIGVLSVAALYGLGRALWNLKVGAIAALFLAVSPLHIWYSQETRMYALVLLWSIFASALLYRAWGRSGWGHWAGYALIIALGMYTHYFFGFVVLAHALFVGYMLLRKCVSRSDLLGWAGAQMAWVLAFAPWIPTVIRQLRGGGGAWVTHAVGHPTLQVLWDTYIGFAIGPVREMLPLWARRGSYVIYLLVLAGAIWTIFRSRSEEQPARRWTSVDRGMFCLIWCIAPIGIAWIASQVKPMYALRYMLPFLPPFCLLVAVGLSELMRRKRAIGLLLAGALIALNLAGAWMLASTPQKPDWRGMTANLIEQAGEGDVFVPEPFWNAKPLRYYAGDAISISDVAPLPATADEVASAMADLAEDADRLWLIEDVAHYGDPDRLLAGHLNAHYSLIQTETVDGIGEVALYQLDDEAK